MPKLVGIMLSLFLCFTSAIWIIFLSVDFAFLVAEEAEIVSMDHSMRKIRDTNISDGLQRKLRIVSFLVF